MWHLVILSILFLGVRGETRENGKPYTVIDVCMFNGEIEILHLRLAEMDPLIDKFYITESATTFSGLKRDLVFPSLLQDDPLIWKFSDRIVYLPITTQIDQVKGAWDRERFVREYALPFIKADYTAQESGEVFLITTDLDEIVNPDVVIPWLDANYKTVTGTIRFNMEFFYYSLRWRKNTVWVSGAMAPLRTIHSLDLFRITIEHTITRNEASALALQLKHIDNAGWHMSYFLTVEEIQTKLKSFSPLDHNVPPYNTASYIKRCVNNGIDLFGRPGQELTRTPKDVVLPKHKYLLSPQFR